MNRMTRKAVIGELRKLKHMFQKRYEKYSTCLEEAIDYIYQTPQWTPVSEGLPKAGECVGNVIKYYLVQNEFGDMLVARYTHSGYWEQIYQYKPCADEIVAWMPLPEPYKEEK